jgi:hypothetical protein
MNTGVRSSGGRWQISTDRHHPWPEIVTIVGILGDPGTHGFVREAVVDLRICPRPHRFMESDTRLCETGDRDGEDFA